MRSIAVCCGFNRYSYTSSLACAVNDAVHPYAELTNGRAFNSDEGLVGAGQLFTQMTTTSDEVLAAFSRAASSHAELVWFSFAGHASIASTGELRLLLPEWRSDGSNEDLQRHSIGARDLEEVMRPHLGSKKFVIVLDTCFSGAFGGTPVSREVSREHGSASAGAVVISACSREQRASDRSVDRSTVNGAFTAALIEVMRDRLRTGAALTIFELFLETKRKIKNGQLPTLYADGLTDDFTVLDDAMCAESSVDIVRVSYEVPRKIENELASFLGSVVRISRGQRVGLMNAELQLRRLAADFHRYSDDAFIVSGTNANVVETYDTATRCIIGCTTPRYLAEWGHSGAALLAANEQFVNRRNGRVIRFFFVREGFQEPMSLAGSVIRDHVKAGVRAVIVNADSFGAAFLHAVGEKPGDLRSLECAFVDGKTFLKTLYIERDRSQIEIDQCRTRCEYEYKTKLRPFLSAYHGRILKASLDSSDGGNVTFSCLAPAEIEDLRLEIEGELGVPIANCNSAVDFRARFYVSGGE